MFHSGRNATRNFRLGNTNVHLNLNASCVLAGEHVPLKSPLKILLFIVVYFKSWKTSLFPPKLIHLVRKNS